MPDVDVDHSIEFGITDFVKLDPAQRSALGRMTKYIAWRSPLGYAVQ